jgi:glycosyltransferase involved in cell wall biosynthesis
MKKSSQQKLRLLAKKVYHRLPLSQTTKWKLRARLQPVLMGLAGVAGSDTSLRSFFDVLRPKKYDGAHAPDFGVEHALAAILQDMAAHAQAHGAPRIWMALPFLATGGAEWAALNLCRAARELRPEQSVVLLVTDKNLVSERMELPPSVLLVVFDKYLDKPLSYERKQALLRGLLMAGQPHVFHNINSEVAWHLILAEGEQLKRYTRLYASIFAFQFAPDDRTKIGYAAYFLKKGMPHLAGLHSDNQRFVTEAAREYELSINESARLAVLYQPCRLLAAEGQTTGERRLQQRQKQLHTPADDEGRRPQFLWAGRLDAEKRVDLFLEIVQRCSFADFRVYGQVVLNDNSVLPSLPNLSYEGPFTSPMEWLDRYDFDAFVFTSKWEGMPNILLEVGTLGIPVIAPTVGGVGELVDETTGYPLAERPSAADYEQALRHVVLNPAEALQRAQRMHDLIRQRHSWSSFVASVSSVPNYLLPVALPSHAENESTACGRPLVSIIVPCFNQGHYLQQSVASALSACSYPLEIIVVDDGSSDTGIRQQLADAELLAPGVVRIHRQTNMGLSGARNSGIALAQGKYLQFLDADDVLTPGKIDAQIAQLLINPELDVSVCNYLLCDETRGMFTKTEEAIARFEINEQDFLYRWERGFVIPIHCGLFRHAVLREHRFDTHARAKEDWLFWTSLSIAGTRFGYLHGHWAIYRHHESSMRRSYVNMGRAWLQAGLKINEMVGTREPLFFESVVSWFEQCYRSHADYRTEIAQFQVAPSGGAEPERPAATAPAAAPDLQARKVADAILMALSSMAPLKEPPLLSVVVPIFGHFEYLQGCLASLASQADVQFEIICVDDGSPDPRISLLIDELRDRNPRLIAHRELVNRGISAVQNLAVEMARGEYVAFLDCDDALVPGALKVISDTLQSVHEVDYLFTDRTDIDENGKNIRLARYGGYDRIQFKSQDRIADDLLDGMVASHLKVIRRSVYRALGGCDERFSGVQDWELALRIAQGHRLHYVNNSLYRHRIHKRSVTNSDNVAQLRKTNVVLRKYLEPLRGPTIDEQVCHIFLAQDFPIPTIHLRTIWKQGGRCVADLRGLANLGQINFLREFNAYFDEIAWSDPQVPAALYGYLCKDVILVRKPSKFSADGISTMRQLNVATD